MLTKISYYIIWQPPVNSGWMIFINSSLQIGLYSKISIVDTESGKVYNSSINQSNYFITLAPFFSFFKELSDSFSIYSF